ncbi:Glycoside hydrolase family 32 [Penicillium cataractarum]|uniref:Glycoside hydrolase family 32 n=1 Tax=Penicillium cataractarum TaxID=2100454 RepID=A0A9W9UY60_9EURO|nr:Glycoside hydrolase family 32 [Penicillium cataractarum]KAJ5359141.1 Glycoside hydrolase family 32 [Penicillium cataractarum]
MLRIKSEGCHFVRRRSRFTTITWTPSNSTVAVSRLYSSAVEDFTNTPIYGRFEPYRLARSNQTKTIEADIFVDGSLLEIFINDRFALTTRTYSSRTDALGITLLSNGGRTIFENITVYNDMLDVWLDRPMNSSSPLHYDRYYETHITFPIRA